MVKPVTKVLRNIATEFSNALYFGDCLDVLKKLWVEHPAGFIDLIYIDPPFNSKRNYNILFEDAELKDNKAQKEAFADTWSNISYFWSFASLNIGFVWGNEFDKIQIITIE